MDPKFQQLRAFYYAYRLRSLTKAGEKLHLTQSAVSRLMQQLESVLGLRLFDRTSGALHSTEAAEEAIAIVERILGDVEYLKTSLQGLAEKRRGHVKFAITPSLAAHLMPDVLSAFHETWVQVEVDMLDATPDRVVDLVVNEVAQFGVVTLGEKRSDLEYTLLAEDQLCLICHKDSPLARKDRLAWADLDGLDVIATSGGAGWPDVVSDALAGQAAPKGRRHRASFSATAVAMAARGLGVTILPALMIRGSPHEPGLVARALHDPVVPRGWYVVTRARRSISPAGLALIELLRASMIAHSAQPLR